MPGLPRKDTVKRFKKLMKKSGKARTNTKAGGHAPSNRIATYEQYHKILEEISWWEKGELKDDDEDIKFSVEYTPVEPEDLCIGLKLYDINDKEFGTVIATEDGKGRIYIHTVTGSEFIIPREKFFTYDFKKREGESDFEELEPKDLKVGLEIYYSA